MHILIVTQSKIPAEKYGGTQRVIWGLGKALVQAGHKVSFMAAEGSVCEFATNMIVLNKQQSFEAVSYTHLDVYKRQILHRKRNCCVPSLVIKPEMLKMLL